MVTIWKVPVDIEELNRRAQHTLCSHLGIRFIEVGGDFLKATMPVDEKTKQPMGILHGGASCALAETVGSAAANYCLDPQHQVAVGLEININHLRPMYSGVITAIAKPFHLGNTTQVWEIKIFTSQQKLVAIARHTVAVIDRAKIVHKASL